MTSPHVAWPRRSPRQVVAAVIPVLLTVACGSTVQQSGSVVVPSGQGDALGVQAGQPGGEPGLVPGGGSTPAAGPTAVGAGGGATGGATGGLVPSAGAVPTLAPGPAGIPTTGRGWDAHSVYIGISTADDFTRYASGLGYKVPTGSAGDLVRAIVADINRRGGLLGRKLVPVFRDHSTANIAANAQQEAAADCAYFSSDRPVIAYFDSSLGQQSHVADCMKQRGVPFFDINSALYSAADFRRLGPALWPVVSPELDRLVPTWIARLQANDYFHGWDSTNGTLSNATPRVGLYLEDNPLGHRIARMITDKLPGPLRKTALTFYYSSIGQQDSNNAQLQFRSGGVTHVLTLPSAAGAWVLFAAAADAQHYRPRYGLTSYDWLTFAQDNIPDTQLMGSIGVGWRPSWDADSAHQPATMPGRSRCTAALRRAGYTGPGGEGCDAFFLLGDAASAAGGFGPAALSAGVTSLGSRFKTAGTFTNGVTSTSLGLPGAVRDVGYDESCSCFTYRGGVHPL